MRFLKHISLIILFAWQTVIVFGQFGPKDENVKAMLFLQQNELDSAKKYTDIAITNPSLTDKQVTWFYRGYIYKTLFKQKDKNNKFSPYRDEAIKALLKSIELNQDPQVTENSRKSLKFLVASYYNDAAIAIQTDRDAETALKNFEKYKKLVPIVNPNEDLKKREVEFYLALATLYNSQDPSDTAFKQEIADKAIELYKKVLDLDPDNPSANYNMGILYYNKAASLINKMDYDESLDVVNKKLDHCVSLFLKALPYMQKAYEQNWRRKDVLEGLTGIYYGLNDDEKYEKYKAELEAIKNENK
jgi:tetratricopeptide (TPR) repeat protein